MSSSSEWVDWMRSGLWEPRLDTALPVLPSLASKVVRLAMDPDVSSHQITAVVTKDMVLATKVIRLANSAFSAPATEITTIGEAVVRMGTRAVRNIVIAECLTSRLRDPRVYGSHGRDLLDHSIGTAYLSWLVAERAHESPDEAFLYGLLHDLGKLLILKLAHDFSGRGGTAPSDDDVATVILELHAEMGGHLLRRWQLPESLHDPVVWHHQPERAQQAPNAAAVAYVANRLAHRYSFGCALDEFDPLTDAVFEQIGLDARYLAQLDSHAPGLFEVARQIVR